MKRLSILVGALIVSLVLGASAAARPPSVQVSQFGGGGTSSWLCGFPVTSTLSVEVTTTTFYDAQDVAIRTQTRSRAVGTDIGPTGLVAWYDQEMNATTDLALGTQTVAGQLVRETAPGVGLLLQSVGRIALQIGSPPEVLFESGHHDSLVPEAWAPVCAYLQGA